MSNTNTPQRTYIQKDGTIIPHSSRPLSARFSDLVASLVLFLTLFWQSLFNPGGSSRSASRGASSGARLGGSATGSSGPRGGGSSDTGRRFGTVDDIRSRIALAMEYTNGKRNVDRVIDDEGATNGKLRRQ